ncbi:hypothetical protein [Variovorax sp. IB41]|uniref:hypothetical protein n=1 Tax=Variovorax sp. IB41 TaxID=2779370 RepID=UPI0018E8DD67|nr:hypothetical protein [Variovorax sp. IB41]MBJ2154261.1 hypothetical protein [Variovorax sp. IB41]
MTQSRKPAEAAAPRETRSPGRGASAPRPAPAKKEGPTATRTTSEGASVGKAGNSTAGGAAGQLTPKD